MIKIYLKQGWQLIRQNKFYTAVYVLGTGLAIAMVMIMAIVYHIRTADIAPESNRDRMLMVERGTAKKTDTDGMHSSSLSYQTVKACYYTLKTPQIVSAASNSSILNFIVGDFYTRIPGGKDMFTTYVYSTDAAFFRVFDYSFIAGKPYSEEEFQSGMHYAVLSESMAKKLFNSTDVLSKTVLVNDVDYTVTGVVKDVSPILGRAYAELWIPYTSVPAVLNYSHGGGIAGCLSVYMLADSKKDNPAILEEIEQNRKKYNTTITGWEYNMDQKPVQTVLQNELKKLDYSAGFNEIILRIGLIAFIFLLVPAVNLSGLTSSRMQERISEMGIRKAFGANKGTLVNQILTENLLLTLLGGIAGLIFSYITVYFLRDLLFTERWGAVEITDISFSVPMLLNMHVFGYALGICVLLNILSSYIPVWNAARRPIVQSINDK